MLCESESSDLFVIGVLVFVGMLGCGLGCGGCGLCGCGCCVVFDVFMTGCGDPGCVGFWWVKIVCCSVLVSHFWVMRGF